MDSSRAFAYGEAEEIDVDLFAGGGGASSGIARVRGEPAIAVNHDRIAIAVHRANHPTTEHLTCDVFEVDPVATCRGRPVGLLWASPDCRHHSKAKGKAPREKGVRALADVVIVWARLVQPRVIRLENVEEFADWGPLLEDGSPCPAQKGLEFRRWVRQLEECGYRVEWRELVAADYGAPTTRKRLYVCARRDGQPITWPRPTRARGGSGGLPRWRTAAECMNWTIPGRSIFRRPRPLVHNTLSRIAKGLVRYVLTAADPFIVPDSGGVAMAWMEQANTGMVGHDLRTPLSTIIAKGCTQRLITAYFVKYYGNDKDGVSMREPMHTVTTKDRIGLVRCEHVGASTMTPELLEAARIVADFLRKFQPGAIDPTAEMVRVGDLVLVDITLRMLAPRELARAQGFPDSYILDRGLFETFPGSGVLEWRPVSATDQVRLVGNSVCPDVAERLAAIDGPRNYLERA